MNERPLVIAHRGASADHPENTLVAFTAACAAGADAIELDVRSTADGTLVVWHDRTLAKIGGGRRRIESASWGEIRQLQRDEAPARRIPTLDDVLACLDYRIPLRVEVKVDGHRRDVARIEAVARRLAQCAGRHHLLCFEPELLAAARAVAPGLPLVLNWSDGRLPRLDGYAALAADLGAIGPSQVRTARRNGVPLWLWTVNTEAAAERALGLGAAAILTDRPAWLRRWLDDQAVSGSSEDPSADSNSRC